MRSTRDPDLLIKAFIDDGLDELSERSYDAVRAAIDDVHQLRAIAGWRGFRTPAQPGGMAGLSPRLSWIALCLLLLAAVAGAVVVGALLRENNSKPILPAPASPTLPAPSPTMPAPAPTATVSSLTVATDPLGNDCRTYPDFDEEFLVEFVEYDQGFDQYLVLVSPDGNVLTGRRSELTFDGGLRQRRLNDAGLRQLAELVAAANLRNCQAVVLGQPNSGGILATRTAAEPIVVSIGQNPTTQVRRETDTETAAITDLADKLRNLDTALGPSSWRDSAWQRYVPEQWKLTVALVPESWEMCGLNQDPTSEPAPLSCLPWAADMRLPDGTPLLSVGTLYSAATVGGDSYTAGYRCAIVDRETALQIATFLDLAPGLGVPPGLGGPYEQTFDDGAGEHMAVLLAGMLPGDDGCAPPAQAPEPVGTPPSDLAPVVDACALIRGSIEGAGDTRRSHIHELSNGGLGWWTGCYAMVSPGDIALFVRGRSTPAADAASYVASLFGDGLDSEQIDGRTIYWNDCFDSNSPCTPAAAVASEPHLLVFTWLGQTRDEFRAMLVRAIQADLIP